MPTSFMINSQVFTEKIMKYEHWFPLHSVYSVILTVTFEMYCLTQKICFQLQKYTLSVAKELSMTASCNILEVSNIFPKLES